MKPEYKERWVAALRSGQYNQTTGALRDKRADQTEGFCCLGVLCDVVKDEVNGAWKQAGPEYNGVLQFNLSTDAYGQYAPGVVRDLVDLDYEEMHELAEMNDRGETFLNISNWIEENL